MLHLVFVQQFLPLCILADLHSSIVTDRNSGVRMLTLILTLYFLTLLTVTPNLNPAITVLTLTVLRRVRYKLSTIIVKLYIPGPCICTACNNSCYNKAHIHNVCSLLLPAFW